MTKPKIDDIDTAFNDYVDKASNNFHYLPTSEDYNEDDFEPGNYEGLIGDIEEKHEEDLDRSIQKLYEDYNEETLEQQQEGEDFELENQSKEQAIANLEDKLGKKLTGFIEPLIDEDDWGEPLKNLIFHCADGCGVDNFWDLLQEQKIKLFKSDGFVIYQCHTCKNINKYLFSVRRSYIDNTYDKYFK